MEEMIAYMKKIVLAIMMLLISNNLTAKWILITHIDVNNRTSIYVDYDTIRKKGNFVSMWALIDFMHEQKLPDDSKYFSGKEQFEYDCITEQTRNLYVSLYSRNMGEGTSVYISDKASNEWVPIVPESVGKTLWEIACDKHNIRQTEQPEWLKVFVTDNETYYIDPISIYKNKQFIKIWQLIDSNLGQKDTPSLRLKTEFDCKLKRFRIMSAISHSDSMGLGHITNVLDQVNKWEAVGNNVITNRILDIICD